MKKIIFWMLAIASTMMLVACSGSSSGSEKSVSLELESPADLSTEQELSLTLSWSGDATSYDVYVGITSGGLDLAKSDVTEESYALSGLRVGKTYYWQVVGKKGDVSKKSAIWSFTTIAKGLGLVSPADEATVETKSVKLSWSGNADKYAVYVGESADNLQVKKSGLTADTCTLEFSAGVTYYWKVVGTFGTETLESDVWSLFVNPPLTKSELVDLIAAGKDVTKANVSQITDMSYLMRDVAAKSSWDFVKTFNQDISGWDVSNVKNMQSMFYGAISFNQPLEKWNVSKVTNMKSIFDGAIAFNQPLESWDVSSVETMERMFFGARSFNQPLDGWTVNKVTNMQSMFGDAKAFNQDLNDWDVSSVVGDGMKWLFTGASEFNGNIADWDVSKVTSFYQTFKMATKFNRDIGGWTVDNVTDMQEMFGGESTSKTCFNQDISGWNVGNVTRMGYMFRYNDKFNQDLSGWDVSGCPSHDGFDLGCSAWTEAKPNFQ